MKSPARLRLVVFLLLQVIFTSMARAEPITISAGEGFKLLATGGIVTIHFAGSLAGFESVLFLSDPGEQGPFFPNHATAEGAMESLGAFAAGTELIFRLNVLSTGDQFFTGPASRNLDNIVHAQAVTWSGSPTIPNPGILVGFEDLFGGGDLDFDDFKFVATNVEAAAPVPEPGTLLMFGSGAVAIARIVRRRNAKGERLDC